VRALHLLPSYKVEYKRAKIRTETKQIHWVKLILWQQNRQSIPHPCPGDEGSKYSAFIRRPRYIPKAQEVAVLGQQRVGTGGYVVLGPGVVVGLGQLGGGAVHGQGGVVQVFGVYLYCGIAVVVVVDALALVQGQVQVGAPLPVAQVYGVVALGLQLGLGAE